MIRLFFILLVVLLPCRIMAQVDSTAKPKELINWMTLQEAEQKNKQFAKAIMIFVHTDWCGWCKKMTSATFSNPGLAAYINMNFYPVKLNAETRDSIRFQDSIYVNTATGAKPTHNLARTLLNDQLTYPTVVFYNDNFRFKLIVPGYQTILELEPLLVFTTEYVFKTTAVEKFRDCYMKATLPDTLGKDTANIHWLSISEALEKNKAKPGKMMILLNSAWCNSGRVFRDATFKDSLVMKITNELFYPVYFDAESKDTVVFKNITFTNDGKMGSFHAFAVSLCNGRLVLPSVIFVDSNLDLIAAIPQFYPPEDMEFILTYFGKDHYKTKTWEEFKKTFVPARNQGTEHEFKF